MDPRGPYGPSPPLLKGYLRLGLTWKYQFPVREQNDYTLDSGTTPLFTKSKVSKGREEDRVAREGLQRDQSQEGE